MNLLKRWGERIGKPSGVAAPAAGSVVPGGPPPAPSTPSEPLERYDAWGLMNEQATLLSRLLAEAGVEHAILPEGTTRRATLIVAAADGRRALTALARNASTHSWQVVAHPRRGEAGEPGRLLDLPDTRGLKALTLIRTVATPDGRSLTDPAVSVDLELWRRVTDDTTPRRDGGTFPIGTLVAARRNRLVDYLEPDPWRRAQSAPNRWPTPPRPHVFDVVEPIDLVYTWVDGSDEAWQARKAAALGMLPDAAHNPDAFIAARFTDHDELRYSLRSVQAYASWFRHIWLVTDGQTPHWLNTDHPRLTVVDHRDIFADPSALPVFNSHAIESQLHHIDGLSERYLYVNDDVFFGQPVRPEDFFCGNGLAKLFPSSALLDPEGLNERDVPVLTAAKRSRALVEAEFGRTFSQKTQHVALPQVKAVLTELEQRFPREFDRVMRSRFRHPDDLAVPSSLALYWAYATGRAVVGTLDYGYLDLSAETTGAKFDDWLARRPFQCFCLNDSASDLVTAVDRDRRIREFLAAYYPLASDFERG